MNYYTHWAYFRTKEQAEACIGDLSVHATRLDAPHDEVTDWLLRAEQKVPDGWPDGWRGEIENTVRQHGGSYDGGESTFGAGGNIPNPFMDPDTLQAHLNARALAMYSEAMGLSEDPPPETRSPREVAEDRVTDYLNTHLADYVADNGPLLAPIMDFSMSPMKPPDEEQLISAGLAVMGSGRYALQEVIKLMHEVRKIEEETGG